MKHVHPSLCWKSMWGFCDTTKTETDSIVLLYIAFKHHCLGHSLTFALGNHALCGQPIDLSLADN